MEDQQLGSIFTFHEGYEQLRQKLLDTMHELETMRNMKTNLLRLLNIAYQERDQAREQLQNLVKVLVPSNSNVFLENLPVFPAPIKAKSSFTESNSPSHISSSPVDPNSSPEFSNMNVNVNVNVVDNNHYNFGFEKPATATNDFGNAVIDYLARGKVLPQKGKLLDAVMDAGPLLQTLLLAGPLPMWRNPPPLNSSPIKIPPLNVKELDSLSNTWNSIQKPTLLLSSNVADPLPNHLSFSGGSWNKQLLQFTSKGGVNNNHPSSRNLQRHQYL